MNIEKKDEQSRYLAKMAQLTILDSIDRAPGVDTLEGRIGPLLSGFKGSAHYIVMPPDMYCAPHKHPAESIIYTAKGRWVLCSEGQRRLMEEGSIFFMPPDVETGYEVPFNNPATILIIKFKGPTDPEKFLSYLNSLKRKLEAKNNTGEPFQLSSLPPGHPARIFTENLKNL